MSLRHAALSLSAIFLLAGCGGDLLGQKTVLQDQHPVAFSTGGVVYEESNQWPYPTVGGVNVSVVGADGQIQSATTDSAGIWSLSGLAPGYYTVTYTKEGFQKDTETLDLEAFGQNEVANPFQAAGDVTLYFLNVATVTPFAVTLRYGDQLYDGVGGQKLKYSVAFDDGINVKMSQRVVSGYYGTGNVSLTDPTTGAQIQAVLNTADLMTWSFSKMAIATMNSGSAPLTATTNPLKEAHIQIRNVNLVGPTGVNNWFYGDLYFTATP